MLVFGEARVTCCFVVYFCLTVLLLPAQKEDYSVQVAMIEVKKEGGCGDVACVIVGSLSYIVCGFKG